MTPMAGQGAGSGEPVDADTAAVAELLGRAPRGAFEVVVRAEDGTPMVIRNAPLLDDGTPMPTMFWLLDKDLNKRIGRLESTGGVKQAEADISPDDLARAHDAYRVERDALIPREWTGPRPFGGVGGTRRGVKCLHTHYAWYLAGGDDPVGAWVAKHLDPEQADPASGSAGESTAESTAESAGGSESAGGDANLNGEAT